jgi:hypothetical protein
MNKRLHHIRKEILSRSDITGWHELSDAEVRFLEEVVDNSDGELSENKWKKLYALLANLGNALHKNYRVYRSLDGLLFDTTIHNLTTQEELNSEPTHRDRALEIAEDVEVDKFYQLKRWKFEIDQLNIKINQMTQKRNELMSQYAIEREKFVGGL